MANKKYPQEFRDSTVQLALNSEKSVLQIGIDLGVNSKTIHNWIREYKIANNIKIDARRNTQRSTVKERVDDENIRLRAEKPYFFTIGSCCICLILGAGDDLALPSIVFFLHYSTKINTILLHLFLQIYSLVLVEISRLELLD